MSDEYEFRIGGPLSHELLDTFEPTSAREHAGDTVFRCSVDDGSQLYGILARCEVLGLHIVAMEQVVTDGVRADGGHADRP